jgi:hypothetical protein
MQDPSPLQWLFHIFGKKLPTCPADDFLASLSGKGQHHCPNSRVIVGCRTHDILNAGEREFEEGHPSS